MSSDEDDEDVALPSQDMEMEEEEEEDEQDQQTIGNTPDHEMMPPLEQSQLQLQQQHQLTQQQQQQQSQSPLDPSPISIKQEPHVKQEPIDSQPQPQSQPLPSSNIDSQSQSQSQSHPQPQPSDDPISPIIQYLNHVLTYMSTLKTSNERLLHLKDIWIMSDPFFFSSLAPHSLLPPHSILQRLCTWLIACIARQHHELLITLLHTLSRIVTYTDGANEHCPVKLTDMLKTLSSHQDSVISTEATFLHDRLFRISHLPSTATTVASIPVMAKRSRPSQSQSRIVVRTTGVERSPPTTSMDGIQPSADSQLINSSSTSASTSSSTSTSTSSIPSKSTSTSNRRILKTRRVTTQSIPR